MNARQKQKVIEAINRSRLVKGKYYQDGETCVIGELLLEAGCSVEKLKYMDSKSEAGTAIDKFEWALGKLHEEFGISKTLASDLQHINDTEPDAKRQLVRLLETEVVKPEPQPEEMELA